MSSLMKTLVAASLMWGVSVLPAPAQQVARLPSVHVTITDAQQLAIPGATCTLIAAGSPTGGTVVSDEHGACDFGAVRPGTYVVRVELDGFEPFSRAHLVLNAGDATT